MDSKEFQAKITRLSELADERKQINERLDEIKKEHRELEPDLLDFMTEAGFQKRPLPNGGTIFMKNAHYFRVPADRRADAVKILEQHGMDDMIDTTPSEKRIGDWIKEQFFDPINGPEIPDYLQGVLNHSSVITLQIRGKS